MPTLCLHLGRDSLLGHIDHLVMCFLPQASAPAEGTFRPMRATRLSDSASSSTSRSRLANVATRSPAGVARSEPFGRSRI